MNKYEGTEFTTEDFVALDTLDNVERNVVLALEEHRLGIPQLPFLDDVKISRGKDCKGTLTKIFICSKFCCSFEKKKYFERHSGVCHHQKEKEVKPKKGELARLVDCKLVESLPYSIHHHKNSRSHLSFQPADLLSLFILLPCFDAGRPFGAKSLSF